MTTEERLEEKRQAWVKKHQSDKGTFTNPSLTPEQIELDRKIREHIKTKGSIDWVQGPFGTTFRNIGYVEEYVSTEKGLATKFYGCKVLFKGKLDRETIDAVATVKRTFIATSRIILKYKYVLVPIIPLWGGLLRDAVDWAVQIFEVDLGKKAPINLKDFSPFPRELIKAGMKLAESIPLGVYKRGTFNDREYRVEVKRLFWCLGTVLQSDFAYYWRAQDPLSNLNKQSLIRNPAKEMNRLFDLAISREHQIPDKIEIIRKITLLAMKIPHVRDLLVRYLIELNLREIQPDRDDYYWAGRRDAYDFGGVPYTKSMKKVDQMDKEMGNVILTGA